MCNSGYIQGVADKDGLATGDNMVFVYPDGETAYKYVTFKIRYMIIHIVLKMFLFSHRGRFENKYMIKAKNVDVKNYGCDDTGMFIPTEFSDPLSDYDFYYEPCTNNSFGGGNWKDYPDPYEAKMVTVAPSSVPNSGEGVFLLKDLPLDRPACWYSLYMYKAPDQTTIYSQGCINNVTKSLDYRRHCKKYTLTLSTFEATIDLPPELDINPLPNLGPKVNHHFRHNNSEYLETEHPRWGCIQSVTARNHNTDILKAGDELFTYYGYGKNEFPYDFPWYWEMKAQIEHEEHLKEQSKPVMNLKKSNTKRKSGKKSKKGKKNHN